MKKHLVSRDTEKIKEYMSFLEKTCPFILNTFNCIKQTGVNPELSDVVNIFNTTIMGSMQDKQYAQYIETFLREKLVASVPEPQISGIKISREKLLEMVELPDCKPIIDCLYKMKTATNNKRVNICFYTIEDGVVSVSSSAINSITDMFSFYVENKKALEVYNIVKTIVDSLNSLEEKSDTRKYESKDTAADAFSFLILKNGKWDVDHSFISQII